ncbi:hypothetical protein B0I35DRAFT_500121 [Stachybotrys elegans]|uniref:Uncharacterized protein n=1 Tax=Stachybotrys elegans TaxID=80388 RepID=A0A8K0SWD4_9HYPO|nr:hypothetical protein B0I35DRAFT_500121 [Stachybotrys elegans]
MAPAWLEKHIVREDPSPDPRRGKEQPVFEFKYSDVEAHHRVLTVEGEATPRYDVTRRSILIAFGDKITVTSPINGGETVAVIDFHTLPSPRTVIEFPQRRQEITVKMSTPEYESLGGLGRLRWKGTGMALLSSASWELRDQQELIMSVAVDAQRINAMICLWRSGLSAETIEELVIVGISQVEGYKRMIRTSMVSAASALA